MFSVCHVVEISSFEWVRDYNADRAKTRGTHFDLTEATDVQRTPSARTQVGNTYKYPAARVLASCVRRTTSARTQVGDGSKYLTARVPSGRYAILSMW